MVASSATCEQQLAGHPQQDFFSNTALFRPVLSTLPSWSIAALGLVQVDEQASQEEGREALDKNRKLSRLEQYSNAVSAPLWRTIWN